MGGQNLINHSVHKSGFTDNSKCRHKALQRVDNYYSSFKGLSYKIKAKISRAFHERRFSSNALCLIARSHWMPPPKRLGLFSYYVVCLLKRQISFVNMQNLGNRGVFSAKLLILDSRPDTYKRNISCQPIIKMELVKEEKKIRYIIYAPVLS